jgi:hypothetical protein
VDLADYFGLSSTPPIDLLLFAGDIGLDSHDDLPESRTKAIRKRLNKTQGIAHATRAQVEAEHISEWPKLLGRILRQRPELQIVLVGGNHDALMCSDVYRLACKANSYRNKRGPDGPGLSQVSRDSSPAARYT